VVVCEDVVLADGGGAEMAARILEELRRPVTTPFGERSLSASIGIAVCDADNVMSAEDLLRAADAAMYRAKMDGKARAVSTLS
jgi:GGDEF domain-containing protein